MYLKVNLCIVYLGLLCGCRSAKTIEVRLSPTDGLTKYFASNFHSTHAVDRDSSHILIADKLDVDTFIITNFLHRPSEYYYFAWKEGKKDSAAYKYSHEQYDSDNFETEHLPKLDGESLFFFGKKRDGKYVVIADQNNNNRFDDDSIFIIDHPINANHKKESSLFPKVTISNLFRYYKGQSIPFSATIALRPTVISDPTDPQNSKLVLNFISDESFIGSFKYKRKHYTVGVIQPGYPRLSNKQSDFLIKFIDLKNDKGSQMNLTRGYRIGDTAVIGKRQFKFDSLSPLLNNLILHPLQVSSKRK